MNRIKELRKKNKISQKILSIDLGFAQSTISEWSVPAAFEKAWSPALSLPRSPALLRILNDFAWHPRFLHC